MKKYLISFILFGLILGGSFYDIFAGLDRVEKENVFIDEIFWIPMSNIAFKDFFINKDFRYDTWNKEYYTWGNYNPTIGKFILGCALHFYGDKNWISFPPSTPDYPSKITFFCARLTCFIFALFSCFLIYLMVSVCAGTVAGLIVAAIISFNPIFRYVAGLAVLDYYTIFFGLAGCLLAILIFSSIFGKINKTFFLISVLLAGLLTGFCVSSKLSGFLFLISVLVMGSISILFSFFSKRKKDSYKVFIAMMLVSSISGTVFIISNPFLYRDTVTGLKHMYSHKKLITEKVNPEENISGKQKITVALCKYILYKYNVIGVPGSFKLSVLLNLFLVCAGFFSACTFVRTHILKGDYKKAARMLMLLGWCAVFIAGTLLWISKPWHRFLMPAMIPVAILESIGLAFCMSLIFTYFKKYKNNGF